MKIKVKYMNDAAKELYAAANENKTEVPFKSHDDDFCYDCVATSCEEVAPNVYRYGLGIALQIDLDNDFNLWKDLSQFNAQKIILQKSVIVGIDNGKERNSLYDFPIILDIDARPRSSVWKTGMVLSNCEGTVDQGYTGEIKAVFYHVMPNMPKYEVGDKICQIKIGFTTPMEFEVVDELDETSRGAGGYGSTGK